MNIKLVFKLNKSFLPFFVLKIICRLKVELTLADFYVTM
ncbi:hypothetical protein CECT5772_09477 [Streptococcus equi subsp. ruminatorum CECT 5772]|uniref:Uncharacterized protein n=1 Tax=Streptococcus equi subsp. ruminatorum CECT 5772 TaxID=1051981 RepID=A0A922NSB7_9STRE|nr:hypothetical protein CECT5772_09477 [Streptococcus equi subsp. ruminatorum CECT 5772]